MRRRLSWILRIKANVPTCPIGPLDAFKSYRLYRMGVFQSVSAFTSITFGGHGAKGLADRNSQKNHSAVNANLTESLPGQGYPGIRALCQWTGPQGVIVLLI